MLLLIILLTACILMICSSKKAVSAAGKVLLLILLAFVFLFSGIFLSFVIPWNLGTMASRNLIQMILTLFLVFLFVVFLLFRGTRKKRFLVPAAVLLGVVMLMNGYSAYEASLPKLTENSRSRLIHYDPCPGAGKESGDRLAVLDHPASLTLSGKLPKLDGATALYPVYSAFFRAVYPESAVQDFKKYLTCTTTSGAYGSLILGGTDIIFVAEASKRQAEAARESGVELVFTPIGREAFVFVVNSRNPVRGLTIDEIRSIYSGKTVSWHDFGVRVPGRITAFQREEGSGSQTAFEKMILPRSEMMPPLEETVQSLMEGLVTSVADYRNYPGAIGYSFRFYCTEMLSGKKIRLLDINGVSPTKENIANGTYPLTGQFYAVTRADADENVKAFLEWMQGPEGQELVERTGYTPLN